MEFTEEKYRIDVHYVNSDWKIPIDCFSRLEICADMDVRILQVGQENIVFVLILITQTNVFYVNFRHVI